MARRAPALDLDQILTQALSAQGDDGTDAMLDATSELVGRYGLRRWSVDDVAARAGLARATVYRRFESRDQLVRAALVRDARRFFSAIAAAVEQIGPLEEKVLEGFVVGLELIRLSPVPGLLDSDPEAALALLSSESFLKAGRRALMESYGAMTGLAPSPADRARVEAVAEALVRLGLSLLVTPGVLNGDGSGPGGPPGNGAAMRRALRSVITPLVADPPSPGGGWSLTVRRRSSPPG